jgi:hypothetical protein
VVERPDQTHEIEHLPESLWGPARRVHAGHDGRKLI